ncbi:MAG: serine hydrolase [Chitinophagia bacterium]
MSKSLNSQTKNDTLVYRIFDKIKHPITQKVLSEPKEFRYQIIYTQINRNKNGKTELKNFYLNVDPQQYFNPASMVKMPLAFLSLEKLNEKKIKGVNKDTRMLFDSSYERQVEMKTDSSSADGFPSIAHFIKRSFLISENDPYNRMYQFLGQGEINQKLLAKGYQSARITRQFMGYSEEQNRHTNGIQFLDKNESMIYYQKPQYNQDSFLFPSPVLIGNAHMNRNDSLVHAPFDFTRHNNLSLEDMQQMLQAVVFPETLAQKKRFNITENDRYFLLQYLSQYPSETNYPKYDDSIFYDSYVKFFFLDSTHTMPNHIRVFNKVGWAYGFLTDVSYILDTKNNIDYMLSATVYVNSDGIVNDSKYDEETVGFPFLRNIGKAVYQFELDRPRTFWPKLNHINIKYEQREKSDNRPVIKKADN